MLILLGKFFFLSPRIRFDRRRNSQRDFAGVGLDGPFQPPFRETGAQVVLASRVVADSARPRASFHFRSPHRRHVPQTHLRTRRDRPSPRHLSRSRRPLFIDGSRRRRRRPRTAPLRDRKPLLFVFIARDPDSTFAYMFPILIVRKRSYKSFCVNHA